MGKKKSARLAAFLFGFLFFLCFAEMGLRAYGLGWAYKKYGLASEPSADGPVAVLCLGNSHTKGIAAAPSFSYPEQLEKRLQKKNPAARVVNAGEMNRNSSELLLLLPQLLELHRPRVVTMMLGEPNLWNNEHLAEFLAGKSARPSFFSELRLVRLARLLVSHEFRFLSALPNPGYSRWFRDVPLEDKGTLAMKWVSLLSDQRGFALTGERVAGLAEAREALEAWTSSPKGKQSRLAFQILAELELLEGDGDRALTALEQSAAIAAPATDYGTHHLLREFRTPICAGREARCAALEAALVARRSPDWPKIEKLLGPQDLAPGGRHRFMLSLNERELRALLAAAPAEVLIKNLFSPRLQSLLGSEDGTLALLLFRENPFHERQEKAVTLIRRVSLQAERAGRPPQEEALTQEFNAMFPSVSLPRPGFHINEQSAWLERDLREAVRLVRAHGAVPVLETYPPTRRSLGERNPDPVIRRVAAELGVLLADHSMTLRALFAHEPSEPFYFKEGEPAGDDHLNQRGNAVIADSLYALFEEKGLLR